MATLLDALVVVKIGEHVATRVEHWCGKIPEYSQHL